MSGNDWIEWKGGECPVDKGTMVDVKHRNGKTFTAQHAGCYAPAHSKDGFAEDWSIDGSASDIIAYRPHKPESAIVDRTHILGVNGYRTTFPGPENKYHRNINGVTVDVYDVLVAFNVTCPARAHAIKKLLAAGQRGHKDEAKDLQEAMQAIERSIELLK